MAKKQHERVLPSGAEQKQMRQTVIARLDKIIINWNPRFVTSEKTEDLSSAFLANLKTAREALSNMFLPRSDMRVLDYYEAVVGNLERLEDRDVMSMLSGDVIIGAAVDKILQFVKEWGRLN